MSEKYYTVDQVSKMLDMHPKTIQRYMREGRLHAQKIGKSWRVTGHDLSVFAEGTDGTNTNYPVQGLQEIPGFGANEIKVSAVIDIKVQNINESMHIESWLTAALNSKSPEYGHSMMNSQYIEPEQMIRIMLWGTPMFMQVIMGLLSEMSHGGSVEL